MPSALLFLLIRNTVKCSANRIVTCDSMRAIHVFRLAKAKNADKYGVQQHQSPTETRALVECVRKIDGCFDAM